MAEYNESENSNNSHYHNSFAAPGVAFYFPPGQNRVLPAGQALSPSAAQALISASQQLPGETYLDDFTITPSEDQIRSLQEANRPQH